MRTSAHKAEPVGAKGIRIPVFCGLTEAASSLKILENMFAFSSISLNVLPTKETPGDRQSKQDSACSHAAARYFPGSGESNSSTGFILLRSGPNLSSGPTLPRRALNKIGRLPNKVAA